MNSFIWFLGTAKASIVCLLMMLIAFLMETENTVQNFLGGCLSNDRESTNVTEIHPNDKCTTLTLTKLDNVQFPEMGPPAFSFSYHFCNDGSFDAASKYPQGWSSDNDFDDLVCQDDEFPDVWFVSFSEAISAINIGLVILPVIAFLSLISIGKNFAKQKKYQIDSTQEMIALGITNLTNSFVFGAAANTAAMSRSAVNFQTNSATQLSAWVTAAIIVLSLFYIIDIFVFIPKAALAAIVIDSASGLFKWEEWTKIWKLKRFPFLVTFGFGLRKPSLGLIVGCAFHLIMLLGRYLFPVHRQKSKANIIYLQGELLFPSSDSLSQKIQKNGLRLPNQSKFIIDFEGVLSIDSGAAFGLVEGIFFVAETQSSLHIELQNIEDIHLEMLHQCGLHQSVRFSNKSLAENEKVKQRIPKKSQIISDL